MWNLLIPAITPLLDKILPDAGQKEAAALGQMEINKAEATTDLFRGGWRPAVGWTCVAGLVYQFLVMPILPWVVTIAGGTVPPLPAIDNNTLMTLLIGMLGLGGMRSFEKVKGLK